jgi:hypothetical protein
MKTLSTLVHEYYVARQEAVADSSFSDDLATGGAASNRPESAFDVLDRIRLNPITSNAKDPSIFPVTPTNGIIFSFEGEGSDIVEFAWRVYGWRNMNGPAEIVCDGTGMLGTQQVVEFPHNGVAAPGRLWADTIVVENDRWMKEVEGTSYEGNSVGKLWFDACGYRYFYVEILTSTGPMAVYTGYW